MIRDIDEAARAAVGNWKRFDSFAWYEKPPAPETFAIVYTTNRDADSLTRANAIEIDKALTPFIDADRDGDDLDVYRESHSHWAAGHVDGYAIRVYRDGAITDAFRAYHELMLAMDDYPVLSDETISQIETDDESDAWKNWMRGDVLRELEREYGEDGEYREAFELLSEDDEYQLFADAMEATNTYWIHESSGPTLGSCFGRVVEWIADEIADVAEYLAQNAALVS